MLYSWKGKRWKVTQAYHWDTSGLNALKNQDQFQPTQILSSMKLPLHAHIFQRLLVLPVLAVPSQNISNDTPKTAQVEQYLYFVLFFSLHALLLSKTCNKIPIIFYF